MIATIQGGDNLTKLVRIASEVRKLEILGDKTFSMDTLHPIMKDNFIEIFETEGGSIGKPFEHKKTGAPWEKYRDAEYDLPSSLMEWKLGVWSAGTSYAVINIENTKNTKARLTFSKGKMKYRFTMGEFVNVNLGVSKKAAAAITSAIVKRIQESINVSYQLGRNNG